MIISIGKEEFINSMMFAGVELVVVIECDIWFFDAAIFTDVVITLLLII